MKLFNGISSYCTFQYEGVFPKQRIHTYWKTTVFRGEIMTLNKSEYVNKMTQAYETDPEAEIKLCTAANRDIQSLFDTNRNNKLDMEEYVRISKVLGHNSDSADRASFRIAYNTTESVPHDVEIDTWIRFMTDNSTSATNDTMDKAMKTALHEEL